MCGTENNKEAVATELWLWVKTNQQKKKKFTSSSGVFVGHEKKSPRAVFLRIVLVRIISTLLSGI